MAEVTASKTAPDKGNMPAQERLRERPAGAAPAGPTANILALHDQAGNQAVTSLVQTAVTQPIIQRQCEACRQSGAPCAHCQAQEELAIQRQAESPAPAPPTAVPDSVYAAIARQGGQPLPDPVRAAMEQQFNRNFSRVRVHTDPQAARAAHDIAAAAFTVGQSIWFGPNRFQPDTGAGLHLLSHELAHTVQQGAQNGALQKRPLTLGQTNDPLERAADRAADAVLRGTAVHPGGSSQPVIRRAPKVSPVKDKPNERTVALDNGDRYRVVRHVKLVPHREEYPGDGTPSLRGRIDKNNIWLQVDWCKNTTKGEIKVGVDLPSQAQTLLKQMGQSILSGGDPLDVIKGTELTPFVSVDIAKSRRFTVTVEAKGTVAPVTPEAKGGSLEAKLKLPNLEVGVQGKITTPPQGSNRQGPDWQITGGITIPLDKPKAVKCPTRVRTIIIPEISYECFKEVETRTRTVTRTHLSYLYFKYAVDEFEDNPEAPGGRRNPQEMTALENRLNQGYQVNSITGYASPEGPMKPKNKFMGNAALSQKRADAAKDWIEQKCKPPEPSLLQMRPPKPLDCFAGTLQPTGAGELYSLSKETKRGVQEVEGRPLAEHAVQQFGEDPDETRHRTPENEEELKKREKSPEKQAQDMVYPLLRRAEIALSKEEEESYQANIPAGEQKSQSCPIDVLRAVEDDFEKSQTKQP